MISSTAEIKLSPQTVPSLPSLPFHNILRQAKALCFLPVLQLIIRLIFLFPSKIGIMNSFITLLLINKSFEIFTVPCKFSLNLFSKVKLIDLTCSFPNMQLLSNRFSFVKEIYASVDSREPVLISFSRSICAEISNSITLISRFQFNLSF